MNTYLIYLMYQDDDRCETAYRAYMKTDDPQEVEDAILSLPEFDELEQECIENYQDYFTEDFNPDEQYASVYAENLEDQKDLIDGDWFNDLPILIDER